MIVLRAAENQASREGAKGGLQTNRGSCKAAQREDHEGGHQHLTWSLEFVDQPVESGGCRAAQSNRRHNKHCGGRYELQDRTNVQVSTGGQGDHHSQDHDAEDVIENGSTDHDLPLAGFQISEFSKHTGGNANAGGGHRGACKDRRNRSHVENGHQPPCAQGERQHHTRHRHGEGLRANGDQLIELTLQTSEKQQSKQTQLGHSLQGWEAFVVELRDRFRGHIAQGTEQAD